MITEEAKTKVARTRIEEEIKYNEQILEAAPRFERLMADDDFKGWLKDLEDAAEVHKNEIVEWATQLGLPPMEKLSVTDGYFRRFQITAMIEQLAIRREQFLELANRPEKIIHAALTARERLAELKTKVTKETTNGN